MDLREENKIILDKSLAEFFGYADVDEWFHEVGRAITRVLYHGRSTSENPIIVRIGEAKFVENQVRIASVDDWFCCDHLKKDGYKVIAAEALKRYGIECKAFYKEDIKSGVIVIRTARLDPHFIALLPQVTPWFFRDHPVTDSEKDLILSMLTNDDDALNRHIQEFIASIGLESKVKSLKIQNFVSTLLNSKLKTYLDREKSLLSDIARLENEIRDLTMEYTMVTNQILGIKASHHDDSVNDFANAFVSNPNCKLLDSSNGRVDFIATGLLTNFSKTAYDSISKTMDSCLYDYCCTARISKLKFKKMLDELVLGKRYRVNLAGRFHIDFVHNNIQLLQTSGDSLDQNAIPNPHIADYGCAGGFRSLFNEAFKNGDYFEVLDIAFSEVQNLNWTDYSPVGMFARRICGDYWRRPCVWDKTDKKFISPADLSERLEVDS